MATTELNLSREILFKEIYRSQHGGHQEEICKVIGNQDDLSEFFRGEPPIVVNFKNKLILAIGLGTRPTSGYDVKIKSISQATGGIMSGTVFVYYQETAPTDQVSLVLTSPVLLVEAYDLGSVARFHFMKDVPAYIVVCPTGTTRGCQIVKEGDVYAATFTKVFGPSDRARCELWIKENST
jgi:hypothetical protein